MNADFDKVWRYLRSHLQPKMVIRNWTVLKDYFGEDFMIYKVGSDAISVDAPGANSIQIVPEDEFEAVWEVWPNYNAKRYQRKEMSEFTRHSKYIISILHWYDDEVSNA